MKMPTIHFYKFNEEAYGHFSKWDKYQKQRNDRIVPTTYPMHTTCQTSVRQHADIVTPTCQPDVRHVTAEVKGSKGKGSKGNIIPAKSRDLSDKQKQYQEIIRFLEETLQTRFTNYPKQAVGLKKMLSTGYTEAQIRHVIGEMAKEEFYRDKGFDMMTVANQIPLYKAKARKALHV